MAIYAMKPSSRAVPASATVPEQIRAPRTGAMLSLMSLWEAGLIFLLVAGAAAVAWRLQNRLRDPLQGASLPGPSADPPRFETTMGELRDLREALRDAGPATRAKGAAQPR